MAKVMLVEDDNNLREIYEARLQAEGYTIVAAQDGEEALVVAKKEKPDLIISDVMMPKISGFEMLDILRNTDGLKDVKIIMLTALGQAEDKTRADQLGADKYLVKSQVTLEDIVKTAHQLLDADTATATQSAGSTPAPTPPTPPPVAPAAPTPPVPPNAPLAASTDSTTPVSPAPTAAIAEPASPAPEPAPVVSQQLMVPASPAAAPAPNEPEIPAAAVAAAPTPAATPVIDAASTAAEQATMQNQIEDFISSTPDVTPVNPPAAATTSATSPAPEPVASPTATPAATLAPMPETPASTAASDQALVSNAVDSLVESTETQQKPSEVTAVEVPPAQASTTELAKPDTEPDTKPTVPVDTVSQSTDNSDSVTIAHKKVIQPINDLSSKANLDSLLAKEEANLAVTPPPATAVVNPQDTAAASDPGQYIAPEPKAETGPDPNNIAL